MDRGQDGEAAAVALVAGVSCIAKIGAGLSDEELSHARTLENAAKDGADFAAAGDGGGAVAGRVKGRGGSESVRLDGRKR